MPAHGAQPRCLGLSVVGEAAPGPGAKGQGCGDEGSVPGGLQGRHTDPVAGTPVTALGQVGLVNDTVFTSWGSGSLTVQGNQYF